MGLAYLVLQRMYLDLDILVSLGNRLWYYFKIEDVCVNLLMLQLGVCLLTGLS